MAATVSIPVNNAASGAGVKAARLEVLVALAALSVLSTTLPKALVDAFAGQDALPNWPIFLGLYVLMAALSLHRFRQQTWRPFDLALSAVFVVFPILSVLWSADAGTSMQHGLVLIGTMLVAAALAGMEPRAALRLLAWASVLAPLVSFLAIAVWPEVGLEQEGPWVGSWRGVHDQKNGLGAVCAFSLLILLAALLAGRVLPPAALAVGLLANLALLMGARSTTSMVTVALSALALLVRGRVLIACVRTVPLLLAALFALVLLRPELLQQGLEMAAGTLGKDGTLSNRLPIWSTLAPYLAERPWLGYGYDAFWAPGVLPAVAIERQIQFLPSVAHNGFVEIMLGLGLVGLGLLLAVVTQALVRLQRMAALDPVGWLPRTGFALICFLTVLNLTESWFLVRNDRITVAFAWICLVLAQRHAEPAHQHSDGIAARNDTLAEPAESVVSDPIAAGAETTPNHAALRAALAEPPATKPRPRLSTI